jgi:hypothetical protein
MRSEGWWKACLCLFIPAAARLEFLRRELHDLVEYPPLVFQPEPYRIPDTAE